MHTVDGSPGHIEPLWGSCCSCVCRRHQPETLSILLLALPTSRVFASPLRAGRQERKRKEKHAPNVQNIPSTSHMLFTMRGKTREDKQRGSKWFMDVFPVYSPLNKKPYLVLVLWYKKHICEGFRIYQLKLVVRRRYNNRNVETESDRCALGFQTTGRLHGNAQRWESNKAINNIGHSLVQDKIEVEGALTGPLLLLLLLLLSLQLSFHRDIEEENSQQSQCEERASLCPRHLSRLLLTSPTPWQLKIFTFSLYRLFSESSVYNALFLSRCPVRLRAFSLKDSSLVEAGLTKSSRSAEKKKKKGGRAG